MKAINLMRAFSILCIFSMVTLFAPSHSLAQGQSEQFLPFTFVDETACNGELVTISGYFHQFVTFKDDGNGGFHTKYHVNAQGEGIGQTTGATYLWRDVINDNLNIKIGETYTFMRSLKLIAKGNDAPSGHLNARFHVTINANGEVTTVIDEFNIQCQ